MKTSIRMFLAGGMALAAISLGQAQAQAPVKAPAKAPAAPAPAAAPTPVIPPGQPSLMTAAEIAKAVAKMTDGVASATLPVGKGGSTVILAHRDRDGEVELHDNKNDVLIGSTGTATVLVGGKVSTQRQIAPGEWRGGEITGAKPYRLGPGDTLWIPAGLPHKMLIPKGKQVIYFAVKSDK